jgi:adenylylsulfate kinase
MKPPKSKNITWQGSHVTREERELHMGQKGAVVWFTGLSGSGKSTLSRRVEQLLLEQDVTTYVLDGDNLRHRLNADLGFSHSDRTENIRRVGCVAQLMADAGLICLTAFISPYRADRDAARRLLDAGRFFEVFVDTPLAVCEQRDPKGLYRKARAGKIPNFTGISAPYEPPASPELVINTDGRTVDDCAMEVIETLRSHGLIPATLDRLAM